MKKMKKIRIVIIFGILLISCSNIRKQDKEECKIEKADIKVVDFSIKTIVSVDYNKYEEYFNKEYKYFSIMDKGELINLSRIIETIEPIDSTYYSNVDTRAIMNLISNKDTTLICVGNLSLSIDGKIFKTPKALISFLEGL